MSITVPKYCPRCGGRSLYVDTTFFNFLVIKCVHCSYEKDTNLCLKIKTIPLPPPPPKVHIVYIPRVDSKKELQGIYSLNRFCKILSAGGYHA